MDAQELTSHPRVIAVPSDRAWLDPRLLASILETTFQDVFVATNAPTLIAKRDPTRVAVAFTFPNAVAPGAAYGPWTDPSTFLVGVISSATTAMYTLREHYTMPTLAWYVQSAQNMTFRVMQIRRVK